MSNLKKINLNSTGYGIEGVTDTTLSVSGIAADAKVTGGRLTGIENETASPIHLNWVHGGIDNTNGQYNNEGSLIRSRVEEYYKESDLYQWSNPNNYTAYAIRYLKNGNTYTYGNSVTLYGNNANYTFNAPYDNSYIRFDIRKGLDEAATTSLTGYTKIVRDVQKLSGLYEPTTELFDDISNSWNSTLHEGLTGYKTPCERFAALMSGDTVQNIDAVAECESFLFFTDPHTQHGAWSAHFEEYMGQIQKVYRSTPTNFVISGGDWLGNSDTPSQACYKMGLIGATCRSMLEPCYMLVGNHDTNYQGKKDSESATYTTRLPNESISNLWYGGKKAYFSFDGSHTKFYCFDTGIESQVLSDFDNYGYEQADWFAQKLLADDAAHGAMAMHMYYTNNAETTWSTIAHYMMQIAACYNTRGNMYIRSNRYDFANCTGKIEFAIAGHTHFDSDHRFTEDGADIPVIITKDCGNGTTFPTDVSFDLMFVDYDNRQIKCIRVGNGSDRTFNLDN